MFSSRRLVTRDVCRSKSPRGPGAAEAGRPYGPNSGGGPCARTPGAQGLSWCGCGGRSLFASARRVRSPGKGGGRARVEGCGLGREGEGWEAGSGVLRASLGVGRGALRLRMGAEEQRTTLGEVRWGRRTAWGPRRTKQAVRARRPSPLRGRAQGQARAWLGWGAQRPYVTGRRERGSPWEVGPEALRGQQGGAGFGSGGMGAGFYEEVARTGGPRDPKVPISVKSPTMLQ
ncbi:hypothetical protein NDU88_002611 [Pleurodeles waltl]|uniref:Uncharacterized protein n=1 Tax=Pleurodeles waltl TaxID=8319 RepID=A0AAV7M2Q3_PLEWA|nr:hypothetical protein NDU88_002611 [Pleurodeles waltl]